MEKNKCFFCLGPSVHTYTVRRSLERLHCVLEWIEVLLLLLFCYYTNGVLQWPSKAVGGGVMQAVSVPALKLTPITSRFFTHPYLLTEGFTLIGTFYFLSSVLLVRSQRWISSNALVHKAQVTLVILRNIISPPLVFNPLRLHINHLSPPLCGGESHRFKVPVLRNGAWSKAAGQLL